MATRSQVFLVVATAGLTGVETVVFNIARALSSDLDFRPVVVTFNSGPLIKRLTDCGIEVEVIPISSSFDVAGIYRFIKYFKTRRGLLHSHGARALLASSFVSLSLGTPHIATIHQFPIQSKKRVKDRFFEKVESYLIAKCKHLIFVSKSIREYYQEILPTSIAATVIHNCIDGKYINIENQLMLDYRESTRAAVGATEDTHVIGCIGRFHPVKGQEFLVRACQIVAERSRSLNIKVLLIGNGPDEQRLRQLVSSLNLDSVIEFIGTQGDLQKWYPAIDTLVIPSISESFGLVGVEAASLGLNIVSSDCPSLIEVLDGYKYCTFCETGNAADLADKLNRYILAAATLQSDKLYHAISFSKRYSSMTFLQAHRKVYLALQRAEFLFWKHQ